MIELTCGMVVSCHKPGCRRCAPEIEQPELEDTDPMYAALVAAKPYLDANWRLVRGGPLKPSERISFAYYIMATERNGADPAPAREWLASVLEIARTRFRDGFFADPFGEPVRRPV